MELKTLIEISHKYGSDMDLVLAGGGNTSCKDDRVMVVKASGTELSIIEENGFVKLDMEKLNIIRKKKYPEDREQREAQALADLMDSRLPGETGRPSVESLLHALIPVRYIVHTHPALVNGFTCSVQGEKAAERLFPDRALWIPLVDPGYILAKTVDDALSDWMKSHEGKLPDYIFLQNHGLFLWGENKEEIAGKSRKLFDTLKKEVSAWRAVEVDNGETVSEDLLEKISSLAGPSGKAVFTTGKEIRKFLFSRESCEPLVHSLSPDHIVYMGHTPLIYDSMDNDELFAAVEKDYLEFIERWGKEPKTILLLGKGFISVGNNPKGAGTARLLMLDAIRVIRVASFFGGPEFMSEEKVNFINTWEVEKYRAKQ